LTALNTVISVGLLSVLFAAIYKVLPDRDLEWGDVMVGAVVTAILFTIGKSLIGWYIGSSAVASTYGAGALMVLVLWVYYFAQIFLLGAEFTKVYADRHGSKQIKA
jgi:membrane protein